MPNPTEFSLTPQDVADQIGVRVETVRSWADKGAIPCWKTPGRHRRFRQRDIDAFVERHFEGEVA